MRVFLMRIIVYWRTFNPLRIFFLSAHLLETLPGSRLEIETDAREMKACVFLYGDREKLHGGIAEEEFFATKRVTDFLL